MDKLARHNDLQRRIGDFISAVPLTTLGESDATKFNALALEVFAWQFEYNKPYQRLCRKRNLTPAQIKHWHQIPAVTTASFKSQTLFCFDAGDAAAVFHTSGTTQHLAGKNYLFDLTLYRKAALRWFQACCLPDKTKYPFLILGPAASHFRHSSLGQMFSWIKTEFGTPESIELYTSSGLDIERSLRCLKEFQRKNQAVFILATSLALLEMREKLHNDAIDVQLPLGSIILDTGGYKGRKTSIDRATFIAMIESKFGVPKSAIYNEYGMTEMSSQFYESALVQKRFDSDLKLAPPWLKSLACDPVTLEILPTGSKGILRYFDLANLNSVAMLQTEDLGIVHENGIELIGRLQGAEPRGCSLLAEELAQANR